MRGEFGYNDSPVALPPMKKPERAIGNYRRWNVLAEAGLNGAWTVMGVPYSFDTFTENTPAGGPEAIRGACPYFESRLADNRLWSWDTETFLPFEKLLPVDFGDIALTAEVTVDSIGSAVENVVRAIRHKAGRCLVLGGEQSNTFYALRGLAKVDSGIHVVHFDAHTNRDFSSTDLGPLFNANVMSHVDRIEGIETVTHIGVREREILPPHASAPVLPNQVSIVTAQQLTKVTDPQAALAHLRAGSKVYISIDMDVLDPSHAPEVAWPVAGGLSAGKLLQTLGWIARRHDIIGADLVELTSRDDGINLGGLIASQVITCLLAKGELLTAQQDLAGS